MSSWLEQRCDPRYISCKQSLSKTAMLGKNMTNGNPDKENLKTTASGAGKKSQPGK